jgi:hypothetical protein
VVAGSPAAAADNNRPPAGGDSPGVGEDNQPAADIPGDNQVAVADSIRQAEEDIQAAEADIQVAVEGIPAAAGGILVAAAGNNLFAGLALLRRSCRTWRKMGRPGWPACRNWDRPSAEGSRMRCRSVGREHCLFRTWHI